MSTGRMGPTLGEDGVRGDWDKRVSWREKNHELRHKDRKVKQEL